MRLVKYSPEYSTIWDDFVRSTPVHTFQHTRAFLSYHGDRFDDQSLLVFDDKERVVAVFPAASDPSSSTSVVSHPGASFGGLILSRPTKGETVINLITQIGKFFANLGKQNLLYKAVPVFYHSQAIQDDLYALFRLNAERVRVDLSATIYLDNPGKVSDRRKRSIKKAIKAGVEVRSGLECIKDIWPVLEDNLKRKHGTKPVHNQDEISLLANRFPTEISFHAAYLEGKCIAGVVLFSTETVDHAQYISSSSEGYQVSALDLLFRELITNAGESGKKYFDFGISNEDAGMILNQSLYKFKTEFGAGGTVHEFYNIELENL